MSIGKIIILLQKILSLYYLHVIFLISVLGTVVSLYFSFFMNLPACDLCWYQRVFFYPIVLISVFGIVLKDNKAWIYILGLCILGIPFAFYHHLLKVTDLFPKETVFCGESGGCSSIDWELYAGSGITIPLLSLFGFSAIFLLILIAKLRTD